MGCIKAWGWKRFVTWYAQHWFHSWCDRKVTLWSGMKRWKNTGRLPPSFTLKVFLKDYWQLSSEPRRNPWCSRLWLGFWAVQFEYQLIGTQSAQLWNWMCLAEELLQSELFAWGCRGYYFSSFFCHVLSLINSVWPNPTLCDEWR